VIALVEPVLDAKVRCLCYRPYPGHPRGCPNYGKRDRCPPQAKHLSDVLDMARPIWAVWTMFELAAHRDKMLALHPNWTRAQLDCCLYWQGTARKRLRREIAYCTDRNYGCFSTREPYIALDTPEACGVNVTETMAKLGVKLEWPPSIWAVQVALVGTPRGDAR